MKSSVDDYLLLGASIRDPRIWSAVKNYLKNHSWDDAWVESIYKLVDKASGGHSFKLQTDEDLYYLVLKHYRLEKVPLKDEEMDTYWEACQHLFQLELTEVVRDRLIDYLFNQRKAEISALVSAGASSVLELERELRSLKLIRSEESFQWDPLFDVHQLETALETIKEEEGTPIPTGLEEFDKLLNGGLYRGKQAIFIAKPGLGKTFSQINLAVNAAKAGFKVAYISLDNTKGEMRKRIYHAASGMPFTHSLSPEEYSQNLLKLGMNPQNLHLLVGHRGITTWTQIETMFVDLADQLGGLDLAVLDYADVVARPKNQAVWEGLEDIYMRYAGLGTLLNCACVTASQPNKEGYNKKIMGLEDFAGAVAKSRHCAYVFAIRQSVQDLQHNRAWYDVLKVREVVSNYSKPFFMHRATGQIVDCGDPIQFIGSSESNEDRQKRNKETIGDRLRLNGFSARRQKVEEQ